MKFYLAAPFFNEEQRSVCNLIEFRAQDFKQSGFQCFSPRIEALCPPGAPIEKRKKSFQANVVGIMESSFILARIDDYDPGTIWELGFAFGVKEMVLPRMKPRKIFCFTTVDNRELNLMLAQGSDGFLQGIPQVMRFLKEVALYGDYSLAEEWNKEIT